MIPIHFAYNSTSWDEATDKPVPGGQGDRYYATVLSALDSMGVPYTVGRQPLSGALNLYLSNRDRYTPDSSRMDAVSVHTSHGLADKRYREHAKTRSFNHLFLPGPVFARLLISDRVPPWKLWVNGYPKLDPLFSAERTTSDRGRVRVLYAPTHGGGSEAYTEGNRSAPGARATSWWDRDSLLELLEGAGFEVTLSPHPRHDSGRQATFQEYLETDVVLADGGSTVFEAMALGLPVVVPAWLTAARNIQRGLGGKSLENIFYVQEFGLHARNPAELPRLIEKAASEGLDERSAEFMETVLPADFRGSSGQRWAEDIAWISEEELVVNPSVRG